MTTAALINIMLFESWMENQPIINSVSFANITKWANAERSALGS